MSDILKIVHPANSESFYFVYITYKHTDHDTYFGDFIISDDGFYHWFPKKSNGGYISAWLLRALADKLDELNKDWNDTINKEFGPGGKYEVFDDTVDQFDK